MKSAKAVLLAAAVLSLPALAGGSAPALAGGKLLNRAELRQLFPGRFQVVVRGYTVRIRARGDGRLEGRYGSLSDNGRWSLRGGKLCIMMKDWLDGKTTCAPVRRAKGPWMKSSAIRFRKL